MSHPHTHAHSHAEGSSIQRAFWLNFSFALIEMIGGVIFNSSAILSDAVHDMGDALVLLMSMLLERKGRKSATAKYSYGMKRLSLVGALINSVVLLSGTLFIVVKGIQSLLNPEPVNASGMFALAILGLVANGLSIVKLHNKQNILERSVFAHLLEDLLGWGAVLIVSVVIYFTDWYALDAILALIIGGIVLSNVARNLKSIYEMVMQASPDVMRQEKLQAEIVALDGIDNIHDLHWWTLDGEHHVFTAKIQCDSAADSTLVRDKITAILNEYDIVDSTIEWL